MIDNVQDKLGPLSLLSVRRVQLTRGFSAIRGLALAARARCFSDTSRLRWVWKKWKADCFEQGQLLTSTEPHNNAHMVFACFKWISLTLGSSGLSYPPVVVFQERTANRVRRYANGRMELPVTRLHLFIHSLAVLDSHCLRCYFHAWRHETSEAVEERAHAMLLYGMSRAWQRWRLFARTSGAAFRCMLTIFSNNARYTKRNIWRIWSDAFRASRQYWQIITCQKLKRHRLKVWKKLTRIRREMRDVRTESLTAKKVSAAPGMVKIDIDACLNNVGSHHTTTTRLPATLASFFWVMLAQTLSRRGRRHQMEKAHSHRIFHVLRMGLGQWQARLRLRSMEDASYGDVHHAKRIMLKTMRTFRSRVQTFLEAKVAQRTMASYGDAHHAKQIIISVRHSLVTKWRMGTKRRTRIRLAKATVTTATWGRAKATAFGAWLLHYSRKERLAVASKLLQGNRKRDVLWLAWFGWRHSYESPVLSKSNYRDEVLMRRDSFKSLLKVKSSCKEAIKMRAIGKMAGKLHRGRKVLSSMGRVCNRILLQRFWARWKEAYSIDSSAISLQSLFRGHLGRKIHFPTEHHYLQWFHSNVHGWATFIRRRLLRLGMCLFMAHHRHVDIVRAQLAHSRAAIRCLHRLKCNARRGGRARVTEARGCKMHKKTMGKIFVGQLRICLLDSASCRAAIEWSKSSAAKGVIKSLLARVKRAIHGNEVDCVFDTFLYRQKIAAFLRLRLWRRWVKYHRKIGTRSKVFSLRKNMQRLLRFTARRAATGGMLQNCVLIYLAKVMRRFQATVEMKKALKGLSFHFFRRHRLKGLLLCWNIYSRQSANCHASFQFAIKTHNRVFYRRCLLQLRKIVATKHELNKLSLCRFERIHIYRLKCVLRVLRKRIMHRKIESASATGSLRKLQSLTSTTSLGGMRPTHIIVPQCPLTIASYAGNIWSYRTNRGATEGTWRRRQPMDDGFGWLYPNPIFVASRLTSLQVGMLRRLRMSVNRRQRECQRVARARALFATLCFCRLRNNSYFRRIKGTFFATRNMRQQMLADLFIWRAYSSVKMLSTGRRKVRDAVFAGERIRMQCAMRVWAGKIFTSMIG